MLDVTKGTTDREDECVAEDMLAELLMVTSWLGAAVVWPATRVVNVGFGGPVVGVVVVGCCLLIGATDVARAVCKRA